MSQKVIALIPARGGSKGIPKKNLAVAGGKSLLERTIELAKSLSVIDAVVVSSDSTEILDVARKNGSEVRDRPEAAASDQASASDVVFDFITNWSQKPKLQDNDLIVYLQPTSPLRDKDLILQAVRLAKQSGLPVASLSVAQNHPLKSIKVSDKGVLEPFVPEGKLTSNRQDLPLAYVADGNVFIFSVRDFVSRGEFPLAGAVPIFSPPGTNFDIDNPLDLKLADQILVQRNNE